MWEVRWRLATGYGHNGCVMDLYEICMGINWARPVCMEDLYGICMGLTGRGLFVWRIYLYRISMAYHGHHKTCDDQHQYSCCLARMRIDC